MLPGRWYMCMLRGSGGDGAVWMFTFSSFKCLIRLWSCLVTWSKRFTFRWGLLRALKCGACCSPWAWSQAVFVHPTHFSSFDSLSTVAYWNTLFLFCLKKGFIGLALCPTLTSPSRLLFVKSQPWLKPAPSFILCDGCCFLSMDFFHRIQNFPSPARRKPAHRAGQRTRFPL